MYLALISLFSCIFQVFIRELERLETNFFSSESTSTPSPHQQHAMLIATLKNTTTNTNNNNSNHKYNNDNNRIVAFVDIDRRSDNFAEQIPLPYLSDLIVSQQFRNQVCLYILVISHRKSYLIVCERNIYTCRRSYIHTYKGSNVTVSHLWKAHIYVIHTI